MVFYIHKYVGLLILRFCHERTGEDNLEVGHHFAQTSFLLPHDGLVKSNPQA